MTKVEEEGAVRGVVFCPFQQKCCTLKPVCHKRRKKKGGNVVLSRIVKSACVCDSQINYGKKTKMLFSSSRKGDSVRSSLI